MTVTGKVTEFCALSVENINMGCSVVNLWGGGRGKILNKFTYKQREERDAKCLVVHRLFYFCLQLKQQ